MRGIGSRCPESASSFVVLMNLNLETICRACISTMELMVAGATSTSCQTVLVVKKIVRQTISKDKFL